MSTLASLNNQNEPMFLTDGGLETWLIFHRQIELREFASFELIYSQVGKAALAEYFTRFLELAGTQGKGFVLDTPTWRANKDWCQKLGFDIQGMERVNQDAVAFMRDIVKQANSETPVLINGVIGPRGDGYVHEAQMAPAQAEAYHSGQIAGLVKAGVDMVSAITMTNSEEAIGIALAAKKHNAPCVISFTVETDGRLPSGQSLGDAVYVVDEGSDAYPSYFMINCAHPDHFRDAVESGEEWTRRIGGIRANASRMSHAELDVAEELDEGNPHELGTLHAELLGLLPNLRVLGGCCGTDHRHIASIAEQMPACKPIQKRKTIIPVKENPDV